MGVQLGNSLFIIPLKHLITLTKTPALFQSLLSYFAENYNKVSDFPLNDSQKDAWKDCVEVLVEVIPKLPESYGELSLIFEYVLPRHDPNTKKYLDENHVVADVIALSADTVLVMEFKRRSDEFEGLFKQAGMYKRRLEKYHVDSWNKDVEAILLLTKAEDYFNAEHFLSGSEGVVSCSPDRLAETLIAIFGEEVKPYPTHPAIGNWLHSEFRKREKEKDYYLSNQKKLERGLRIAAMEIKEIMKIKEESTAQLEKLKKDCDEGLVSGIELELVSKLREEQESIKIRAQNLEAYLDILDGVLD